MNTKTNHRTLLALVLLSLTALISLTLLNACSMEDAKMKKVYHSKIEGKKWTVSPQGEYQEKNIKGKSKLIYKIVDIKIKNVLKTRSIEQEKSFVKLESVKDKSNIIYLYFDPNSIKSPFVKHQLLEMELGKNDEVLDYRILPLQQANQ